MSEELFKAYVRYPAIAARHLAVVPFHPTVHELDYATDKNRQIAYPYHDAAVSWLADNGKLGTFVNCYDNTDHLNGVGVIVFVLNDRNAAIMMKLALG